MVSGTSAYLWFVSAYHFVTDIFLLQVINCCPVDLERRDFRLQYSGGEKKTYISLVWQQMNTATGFALCNGQHVSHNHSPDDYHDSFYYLTNHKRKY